MIYHWAVLLGALAVLYYQTVRNILEPTLWANPPPLLKFEGAIAANNLLTNAVRTEGTYHGPESIAFDPELGTGYVSFGDGVVRSFSADRIELGPVFFTGGYQHDQKGNGLTPENAELRSWCLTESNDNRLAWNTIGEHKCGRPLGIRFREERGSKFLYILDAYHGLFKLDLAAQSATHLVSPHTPILAHPHSDPVATRMPFFFNDLDISIDNKVVFTDSSYRYTRSNNRPEILDGAPRGRLFQYDPATNEVTLLLCGLHFPNGVQFLAPTTITSTTTTNAGEEPIVSDDGEVSTQARTTTTHTTQQDVLVNELTRFRVLKVNTATALRNAAALTASCAEEGGLYQALAPNAHTTEENYAISGVMQFIDNIPGIVDNVRTDVSADGKQYYLFGMGSKSTAPFSLLWTVLQSNFLREILGRVVPMRMVEQFVPRYGLVIVSNDQGEMVGSLHDPSGIVAMISQASRHPLTGDLWIGSHSEPLAILPAKFMPDMWE